MSEMRVSDLRCERTAEAGTSTSHWYDVFGEVNGKRYYASMIISDEVMADKDMLRVILESALVKAAQA